MNEHEFYLGQAGSDYYVSAGPGSKKYLHADGEIRQGCSPFRTGYYQTREAAEASIGRWYLAAITGPDAEGEAATETPDRIVPWDYDRLRDKMIKAVSNTVVLKHLPNDIPATAEAKACILELAAAKAEREGIYNKGDKGGNLDDDPQGKATELSLGPDAESDIDRIVGKASNNMPTTHKYAPTITFKPWTPPRPTLDQMPEGERHRCSQHNKGPQIVLANIDGIAHRLNIHDRPCGLTSGTSSHWTVLDADPPQPETLGDVPAGVAIESANGARYVRCVSREGNETIFGMDNNRGVFRCNVDADSIGITRVLGTPVFSEGGE